MNYISPLWGAWHKRLTFRTLKLLHVPESVNLAMQQFVNLNTFWTCVYFKAWVDWVWLTAFWNWWPFIVFPFWFDFLWISSSSTICIYQLVQWAPSLKPLLLGLIAAQTHIHLKRALLHWAPARYALTRGPFSCHSWNSNLCPHCRLGISL